jgi:glucan-binding YG repeat protein
MAANEWAKASKGWCWLGANGCCVTSKWIKWNGSWYYLQSDSYMATGIKRINGKAYLFNASGKWIR